MPDLHIRNVDPDVIARLKAQAKRNGRSMEAEAREVIERGCPRNLTIQEWLEGMRRLQEEHPIPGEPNLPTSEEIKRLIEAEEDEKWRRIRGEDADGTDD